MATIKYNSEDVMLIAIDVLDITSQYLGAIALKFMLKDHYPDLRGILPTNTICASSCDLVNQLDDPFIERMRYLFTDIQLPACSIANLYGIDLEHMIYNERIAEIADHIYWSLIDYAFPDDDEDDDYDDDIYEAHLSMYVYSIIRIVHCLIQLIDTGEAELDEKEVDIKQYVDGEWDNHSNKINAHVLGALSDLGRKLSAFYGVLYADYLRNSKS